MRTAYGLGGVLLQIEDQDRNGLDRVAGSLENFEAHSREIKRIAILHRHECVFRLGAGAEMDRRAATVAQFQMPGDEVGVKMGEEYVPDLEAEFLRIGQVLLDIALRVDDDGGRTGLVSEQIGSVRKAAEVILFENHGTLSLYRDAAAVASQSASTRRFTFGQREVFECQPYHH